jgi:hypothetical protein
LTEWDITVIIALLFTAIITPYEVALINTDVNAMFFINRLFDIIFCCDIVFCFMLMYKDPDGTWVRNRSDIAKRYAKGWFCLDVAALPPYDILKYMVKGDGSSRPLRMIRMCRLLKLLRLLRLPRILYRWETKFGIRHSSHIAAQLLALLLCCVHWLACGWALITVLQDRNSHTWLTVWIDGRVEPSHRCGMTLDCAMCRTGESGLDDLAVNGAHRDGCWNHGDVYLACLYFAMMTVTSIGYGDILPANINEVALCAVFMLVAGLVWAQIIAGICGIVTTGDPIQQLYFKNTDDLNYMMRVAKIPSGERQHVRTFLQHNRRAMSENERKKVLSLLSPALSGAVAGASPAFIQKRMVYWTKKLNGALLGRIAQKMQTRTFPPRETIPAEDTMYVLKRGAVCLVNECSIHGCLITRSSRKTVWNEDIVVEYKPIRRFHVANTITFVEVECLDKHVLQNCMVTEATLDDRRQFHINRLWFTVFRAMEYRAFRGRFPYDDNSARIISPAGSPASSLHISVPAPHTAEKLAKVEADVGSLRVLYYGLDAKLDRICAAMEGKAGHRVSVNGPRSSALLQTAGTPVVPVVDL